MYNSRFPFFIFVSTVFLGVDCSDISYLNQTLSSNFPNEIIPYLGCEVNDDCSHIANAICSNRSQCNGEFSCTCPKYNSPIPHIIGNKLEACLETANLGEACVMDKQCLEATKNSFCSPSTKLCECTPDARVKYDFECVLNKEFGKHCDWDDDCTSKTSGAFCDSNIYRCNCPLLTYHIPSSKACFPRPLKIGEPCEFFGHQCGLIDNAVCEDSHCACKENHTATEIKAHSFPAYLEADYNICVPTQTQIGGECQYEDQCLIANTTCLSTSFGTFNTCQCIEDTVASKLNSNTCIPVRHGVFEDCEEDAQCSGGGLGDLAECSSYGVCLCKENSVLWPSSSTPRGYMCRQMIPLGGACSPDDLCVDTTGNWRNISCGELTGTCECDVLDENGFCSTIKSLGDECRTTEDCRIGVLGSVCEFGFCTCDIGYTTNNESNACLEVNVRSGGKCTESWQCRSNNCLDDSDTCAAIPADDGSLDEYRDYFIYGGMALGVVLLGLMCLFLYLKRGVGSRRNQNPQLFNNPLSQPVSVNAASPESLPPVYSIPTLTVVEADPKDEGKEDEKVWGDVEVPKFDLKL